jgi:hypothetical protein
MLVTSERHDAVIGSAAVVEWLPHLRHVRDSTVSNIGSGLSAGNVPQIRRRSFPSAFLSIDDSPPFLPFFTVGLWPELLTLSRIWDSHSGGYEEYYLLGYNAVEYQPTLPPAFMLVSCSAYFFDPEDGGDMFLRNVGWHSTDYTGFCLPCAVTLVSFSAYFFDPEDGGDVPPKRRLTLNGLHGVISQTGSVVKQTNRPIWT